MSQQQPMFFVHLGYPKTGTTTLQKGLFLGLHREGRLNFLGNAPGYRPQADLLRCVSHQYSGFKSRLPGLARQLARKVAARPGVPTLLSDECLSQDHHLMHQHRQAAGTAQRLKRLLSPYQPLVVLVLRSQPSLIFSSYVQEYFKYQPFPHMDTFEKFLAYQLGEPHDCVLGMYDYLARVRHLQALFGRRKVVPLLFEDLFTPGGQSGARLAEVLGLSAGGLQARLAGRHENAKKKDQAGYWLAERDMVRRRGESLVGRASRWPWFCRAGAALYSANPPLKWLCDKTLLSLMRYKTTVAKTMVPRPGPEVLAPLANRFRRGNQELAREFGLPLEEHGYPLPLGGSGEVQQGRGPNRAAGAAAQV